MITDSYPHSVRYSSTPHDLHSELAMEEKSQFIEATHSIEELLDDETIVRRFACGKKRLIINENLRINYAHNSLQLSTPNGELIAIHKVTARLHYILVKKDNRYSEFIQEIIGEYQFIPLDTATAERGFMRYQKYEIPEGYTLRYEPAAELWQTWRDNRQQANAGGLQLDMLILARSKWYRVQDAICTDDRLDIQTRLGLISVSLRDRIAWIAKLGQMPMIANTDLTTHQSSINSGSDSEILGKIISKLAIESSNDSALQLNPQLAMSSSSASIYDSSLVYEGASNSTLTANLVAPLKESLQTAAMNVLESYLEHGEITVRKEVTTDAQGNIISEKTVTTQRGCPKWAIQAVLYWE